MMHGDIDPNVAEKLTLSLVSFFAGVGVGASYAVRWVKHHYSVRRHLDRNGG